MCSIGVLVTFQYKLHLCMLSRIANKLCQHYTLYNTQLKIVRQRTLCFASSPDEGYNATRKHIRIADGWCSQTAEGQFFALRIDASIPHCKDTAENGRFQRTSVCFLSVSLATSFHCKDTARKMQNQRTIVRFLFVFANHTNMSQVHRPDSFVQNSLQRYGGKIPHCHTTTHKCTQLHKNVFKCSQVSSNALNCTFHCKDTARKNGTFSLLQFTRIFADYCSLIQVSNLYNNGIP